MEKKILSHLGYEIEEAEQYTIEVSDREYRNVWLVLSNNHRIFPNEIIKLENNSYNDMFVTVNKGNKDMPDYIKRNAEDITLKHKRLVLVARVYGETDYDAVDWDKYGALEIVSSNRDFEAY